MTERRFEFTPTPAVQSARRRGQYIPCPACHSQQQRYLFHRTGVRFVRCRACGLVYADPIDPGARKYFDIESLGQHDRAIDRRHAVADFRDLLTTVVDDYTRRLGRAPSKVLVVGRWMREFTTVLPGVEVTLAVDLCGDEGKLANQPLTESIGAALGDFDIVLLHELLEATSNPITVLDGLAAAMAPDATLTVAFANMKALANRVLRRSWKRFFDRKVSYYDADNLEVLLASAGFRRLGQESVRTRYSLGYVGARLDLHPALRWVLRVTGSSLASVSVAAGDEVASFVPFAPGAVELLSIIVPVYNEELYLRQVLDALLAKELPIDKEVIIVESASTDSSREIVKSFERKPGVRVLYQERARGKGNAVREALEHARGTIVLIQDADFEYDLDDYDALLEPIVQRRSSFVLGSRSLGIDNWKVRQYATSPVKSFLMNFAQLVFARTFNALYQQKVTDINTMFKVFRRDCLDGVHLLGNGFNLDIELVCKIVRNGYDPLEVPVNYVARSFDEGKKINFLLDAYPSYYQLFRCRFGPI
jgi:Glycosyl transferase family 2/Methyltransferase domain